MNFFFGSDILKSGKRSLYAEPGLINVLKDMPRRLILWIVCVVIGSLQLVAQSQREVSFEIFWQTPQYQHSELGNRMALQAPHLSIDEQGRPVYMIELGVGYPVKQVQWRNIQTMVLPESWLPALEMVVMWPDAFSLEPVRYEIRREEFNGLLVYPLRKQANGEIEILISGTVEIIYADKPIISGESVAEKSTSQSVLSSGSWQKLGVAQDGVYRVTYESMLSSGLLSGPVASASVKLYGNGGRMLPEPNAQFRYDDLFENAIQVEDGGDNQFGPGDYFLFYGQSPHRWSRDLTDGKYKYTHHLYADTACYFLTVQGSGGKRISLKNEEPGIATYSTTSSDGFFVINQERTNLIKSGRAWFGDYFNFTTSFTYNLSLPGAINGSLASVKTQVASRCVSCGTNMLVKYNGVSAYSFSITAVGSSYNAPYANYGSSSGNITLSGSQHTVEIIRQSGQEVWFDFLEVNYRKSIQISSGQLDFRDSTTIGKGLVSYNVQSPSGSTIWDVTHPLEPMRQQATYGGSGYTFQVTADTLREYIVFAQGAYYSPTFLGAVTNQNLHGLTSESLAPDLIIVTHPLFQAQALQLAEWHIVQDGMKVHTVSVDQIYNEYSSGMQDITAIRDYVKMYMDNHAPGTGPRYLLLFGDGSFDYKTYLNRTQNNTNFVPCFQSTESFDRGGQSYTSDDFFGLLGNNEGITGKIQLSLTNTIDIGIGRIPVRTATEAQGVVDKIIHYDSNKACYRDWRNVVTLIADDMEAGWEAAFFSNSQAIASQMQNNFPVWNIDKLYLDAFQQVTNAGQRYPEAERYLANRIHNGTLLINYIGHGGEAGLTSERLLGINDVNEWDNFNKLPAFTTATCTFTRFDNPEYLSAGELILLRPDGGGIALFSTVRAISVVPNFNYKFFQAAFSSMSDGSMPRMGDVIRMAKQPTNDWGEQNILLFGDPALALAYPRFRVITDEINGLATDTGVGAPATDTLSASQMVVIKGHIEDTDGNLMTDFNGVLYTTVFDKPSQLVTLANDPQAQSYNFTLQKNTLFRGKSSVKDGEFTVSFKVPLDINYMTGTGKISYYAQNEVFDAHGYYNNFIVGGAEENCDDDTQGPQLQIFMNDTLFVNGGICHANPDLLILMHDESGMNMTGNGIGHDMMAYIDGDLSKAHRLNDFYEANLDDFTRGVIRYPLTGLSAGYHYVVVQIWDGCNNFSFDTLHFAVTNSDPALINVMAYPNPFTTQTTISFEHNQAGSAVSFDILITDLSGRLVKRWQIDEVPDGFRQINVTWDGTGVHGPSRAAGMYVCKVYMTTSQGTVLTGSCKIILIRDK